MKLIITYKDIIKTFEGQTTWSDIEDKMTEFKATFNIPKNTWCNFEIQGEFNVESKVLLHDGLTCLFG